MKIESLSYILIETTDIQKWESYAHDVVGLMKNEKKSNENNLFLRIDESPFRFQVQKGETERYVLGGFELANKQEFDDAKKQLSDIGVSYEEQGDDLVNVRCVEELITLKDPAGNSLELFYGRSSDEEEFKSPQDISGFVTKGLGLGHLVFGALDIEPVHDFYIEVLGF